MRVECPFLARLNNVQEELMYYYQRPQMLKFYIKVFRTALFPNPIYLYCTCSVKQTLYCCMLVSRDTFVTLSAWPHRTSVSYNKQIRKHACVLSPSSHLRLSQFRTTWCQKWCLQRIMLQLQNYDLEVQFVRGTDIPVSDFLSRHSLSSTHPQLIQGLDLHVHTIKQQLFVTDSRLESIRTAIKNDSTMQKLIQTITSGWLELGAKCSPEILNSGTTAMSFHWKMTSFSEVRSCWYRLLLDKRWYRRFTQFIWV